MQLGLREHSGTNISYLGRNYGSFIKRGVSSHICRLIFKIFLLVAIYRGFWLLCHVIKKVSQSYQSELVPVCHFLVSQSPNARSSSPSLQILNDLRPYKSSTISVLTNLKRSPSLQIFYDLRPYKS